MKDKVPLEDTEKLRSACEGVHPRLLKPGAFRTLYDAVLRLAEGGDPIAAQALGFVTGKEPPTGMPFFDVVINRTSYHVTTIGVQAKNPNDAEQVALSRAQKGTFEPSGDCDFAVALVAKCGKGEEVATAEPFEDVLDSADEWALLCAIVDKLYELSSPHIPEGLRGRHPKEIPTDHPWWDSDEPKQLLENLKEVMDKHAPTGFKFGRDALGHWGFWPA